MPQRYSLTTDQQAAFNDALNTGIARKDDSMIRAALQNGAEPDLLMFAAIDFKRGLVDMWNKLDADELRIRWLRIAIGAGANANATRKGSDGKEWPAAHWLHDNFSESVMTAFLQYSVNIDTRDPQGNTLLMRAVNDGKADMAQYYLTRGADPMAPCGDKRDSFPLKALQQGGNFRASRKAAIEMEMLKRVKQPAPKPSAPTPVVSFIAVSKPPPAVKKEPPKELQGIEAPRRASFMRQKQAEKTGGKPAHGFSL